MKYNAILIALAATAMLVACEEKITDREDLDSRTVSQLDVQYSVAGQPSQALSYDHSYARPVIDVTVNNDGLRWTLESDRDWCKVVPGEHRGSGPITLELEANESFEDRETATLTFVAGDYRGFRITVDQSAAAFIISQPYFVTDVRGTSYNVNVTTLAGTDWEYQKSDWLSVVRNPAGAAVGGTVTTVLKITAGTNYDDSRLGSVELTAGAEKDVIMLWQFGNELSWKDGSIFLPNDTPATFSMLAPHNMLKQVNVPDYVTYVAEPAENEMDKLTFTVEDFLNDASSMRDIPVTLTLNNNTSTVVALPGIKQDYKPAGALMSAAGLQAFAEKVAAGQPTTDWEKDGWVTMLQDIDMTGVTDWAGVGTAAHPFTGKFDGGNHKIKNLKNAPHAIFNICGGSGESATATVKNLTLDKSCNFFYNAGVWTASTNAFGAIVAYANNTKIENCANEASIEFSGSNDDEIPAKVGGILGEGKGSTSVRGSRVSTGIISVSATAEQAFIGGIAGSAPSISGCSMSGTIMHEGTFTDMYMGGITGKIAPGDAVSGNSFSGKLNLKGSSQNNYIGGLYGSVDANGTYNFDPATDMSTTAGSIEVNSYLANAATKVFAGGFIGYAAPGVTLSFKDYEVQTSFVIDNTSNRSAGYCCAGGILGGCDPGTAAKSLTFNNVKPQGTISLKFASGSRTGVVHSLYGGVVGFVNGPATFTDCINKGVIGVNALSQIYEGASFNGSLACVGGIAGYAEGGDIAFTSCKNQAAVSALFYVNNVAISTCLSNWVGQSAGGILGAFNLHSSAGSIKLTMQECDNTGVICAYRGFAGGMTGFCQNATITQCGNRSGSSSSSNGYVQGGVAGVIINTKIENCTIKSDVRAGAGGNANDYGCNAGGIAGRIEGSAKCEITGCSYFGKIDAILSANKPQNGGGILGYGPSATVISNCRYGGEVNGTTVTQAKLLTLAVGNGGATAPEATTLLWDGN